MRDTFRSGRKKLAARARLCTLRALRVPRWVWARHAASRASGEHTCQQPLESARVGVVKRPIVGRIDVENANERAPAIEHRYHDLGTRAIVAGDVARKSLDVL